METNKSNTITNFSTSLRVQIFAEINFCGRRHQKQHVCAEFILADAIYIFEEFYFIFADPTLSLINGIKFCGYLNFQKKNFLTRILEIETFS